MQSFDVILGPVGQSQEDVPPEDTSPAIEKVYQGEDGHWTITDVSGLKLGVRWRIDEDGYDISRGQCIHSRRHSR
jgi:mannosidase alpha-like ER degradation enhancer 1